jgi:hypothetical protein
VSGQDGWDELLNEAQERLVRQQRVHERAAAIDEKVFSGPFLQLGNRVHNVALEEDCVPLERLLQCGRGNEFGQAVHPVGELVTGPQRSRGDELVVSDPSEQQRVAREELIGLPLRDVVVPVRHRPAALLVLTSRAGVLHHTVQGEIFGYDDPSHRGSFPKLLG